ncbi:MAG: hypothetical protein GXO80_03060 [Chlorobi bacterium]|nr:hypothetical protein [Chlorobiota bacterium]
MYKILISFFLIFLFSCNYKKDKTELNNETYQKIKHKVKYTDIKQKNGLIKHIGFYPDTKDTFSIFFTDVNQEMKSYSKLFYKNGKVMSYVQYKGNMKLCQNYYKNGNLEKIFTLDKLNIRHGTEKQFYKTGELKAILDYIVYKDSVEYLNNARYFYKNGELNRDSTFFIKMISDRDTILINDSLEIRFQVIKPENTRAYAYIGSVYQYFEKTDYNNIKLLQNKVYYFKPTQIGYDSVEIVFDINITPQQKVPHIYKTFLKKRIYVTP